MVKASLEIAEGTRKQNEEIIQLLKQQKVDNQQRNTYLEAKIPDLSHYFPLPDIETLDQFMDKSDGLFPLKRGEFYSLLMSCRHPKKSTFATSLVKTLFSNEFLRITTWPPNNSRNPSAKDNIVQKEFVALFKCTLSRMCGAGLLDPSFVDLDFWQNWPKKYREAKRYAKSLVGEFDDDDEENYGDEEEDEEEEIHQMKKRKYTKKKATKTTPLPVHPPPTTTTTTTTTTTPQPQGSRSRKRKTTTTDFPPAKKAATAPAAAAAAAPLATSSSAKLPPTATADKPPPATKTKVNSSAPTPTSTTSKKTETRPPPPPPPPSTPSRRSAKLPPPDGNKVAGAASQPPPPSTPSRRLGKLPPTDGKEVTGAAPAAAAATTPPPSTPSRKTTRPPPATPNLVQIEDSAPLSQSILAQVSFIFLSFLHLLLDSKSE